MKERILSAVAITAIILVLIVFSGYLIYPVALGFIATIAVFEILRVMQMHKKLALVFPAYLFAAAFPIIAYFVNPESIMTFILIVAACMFLYLMWLMGAGVFSKGSIAFASIAEIFASAVYVTASFTSLSLIRYIDRSTGAFAVILVFVIAWVCDTAAFVVGKLFGKHKLIPEVSPKKTVEGSVGGVVFAVLLSLLYGLVLEKTVKEIAVNYVVLAICVAILSMISQLGDLIASLIKREHGVKDYGKIFPGHGGIMDRFDSVLAVSTILLIVWIICPPFVFN